MYDLDAKTLPIRLISGRAGYDLAATAAALCGVLALLPLPSGLRATALAVFVLIGPGAALMAWLRLPRAVAIAVTPVVGFATVTAATAVLAWTHRWPPVPLLVLLIAVVVGSTVRHQYVSGVDLVSYTGTMVARVRRRSAESTGSIRGNGPLWLTVTVLVLWLCALPLIDSDGYSGFGLLFLGAGPILAISIAGIALAFMGAVAERRMPTAVFAVGAAILVSRVTPTLIVDVPIYGWTYKHVGVVDYIQKFHQLPPEHIDIYGQWPAFFTSFAWFADVTGVSTLTVAHWFSPVMHVLIAVLIAAICRSIGFDRRTAVTAAMIAELVNWVGQDYFAPQALALVMALGVVALLVISRAHPVAAIVSIGVFAALVPTHQLTPYWLFGVATLLALLKKTPWWVPIPYFAVLIVYLIPRLSAVAPYGLLSGFNPVENATSNVTVVGTVGKIFTSTICRSLSAGVVLAAVLCAVILWRRRQPMKIATVMAFSSFALLAGQSYGGEAIFRVYLYAVPGAALLIAPVLVGLLTGGGLTGFMQRFGRRTATLAVVAAALAGAQGYFGLWSLVVGFPSQVTAAERLLAEAPADSVIMSLYPAGLPTRVSADYVKFAEVEKNFDQPMLSYSDEFVANFPDAGQLDALSHGAAVRDSASFIVVSEQGTRAIDYYGYLPPGAVDRFDEQLRASVVWSDWFSDEHTSIYQYVGPRHE